jgi:hypothetical protein
MSENDGKGKGQNSANSQESGTVFMELELTIEDLERKIAPGIRLSNHNEILVVDLG